MMNSKIRRALLLACCAVMLVCMSVGATLAYLTSTDEVVNTFTVGKVVITLDELDVDNSTEGENDRDQANAYHLMPGKQYTKDPTVHVAAGSEECWVYVTVDNGIAEIEDATKTIIAQIKENWTELAKYPGVYVYKDKVNENADCVVFTTFQIDGDVSKETLADYAEAEIVVTAYAVQTEGFADAEAAWAATFGSPANP